MTVVVMHMFYKLQVVQFQRLLKTMSCKQIESLPQTAQRMIILHKSFIPTLFLPPFKGCSRMTVVTIFLTGSAKLL